MQELVTSSQIYFVFPCICVVDCLFVCLFVNVTIGDMQVHKSRARPMLLFVKATHGHHWSGLRGDHSLNIGYHLACQTQGHFGQMSVCCK